MPQPAQPTDSLAVWTLREAAREWLRDAGNTALRLLSVPQELWIALIMLSVPLFVLRLFYEKGERVKVTSARARTAVKDTVITFVALYFFTVWGNSLPVFGWIIVISWGGAIAWTAGQAVHAMSKPGSTVLSWAGEILSEFRRRNLQSMIGSTAVPSAGPPDPDAPLPYALPPSDPDAQLPAQVLPPSDGHSESVDFSSPYAEWEPGNPAGDV